MELAARTAAWSGEKLPYDAEVEYIQTPGYWHCGPSEFPYIDTGIVASIDDEITIDFKDYASYYQNYFMYRFSSDKVCFRCGGFDYYAIYCSFFGSEKNIGSSLGDRSVLIMNKNEFVFNGASTENSTKITTSYSTIKLFCSNSIDNCKSVRIYSFKITGVNNVNLIPVRVGNVGYMYDTMSHRLFGNSGTGSLGIGPDKAAASVGGGYNLKCAPRRYTRSSRPSARFCHHFSEWEVAA